MENSQRMIGVQLARGPVAEAYLAVPAAGSGPGLLLLHDRHGAGDAARRAAGRLAEEGWVVLLPDLFARHGARTTFAFDESGIAAADRFARDFDAAGALEDVRAGLAALRSLPETQGGCGAVGHGLGGGLALRLACGDDGLACAVAYDPAAAGQLPGEAQRPRIPTVVHLAVAAGAGPAAQADAWRRAAAGDPQLSVYAYEGARPGFENSEAPAFDRPAQMMAKSRTLACLRAALGPVYDLAALWEAHLASEFAARDVDVSMDTMVDDPYVFVVPTVTGGTGKKDLHRWYSNHFHFQNPDDTRIVPISRTIGTDRLVDEFILCFTHDRVMDWILPGVAPTGMTIEIPMIAVVNFRGAKLYHEHIWWDQASVLVQAGLLDPHGLPVTGADQAQAMQDETLPRNRLIPGWN